MAYLDINPNENTWAVTSTGDFAIQNRDVDIAEVVLLSNLGAIKYAPTVGGEAFRYLNANISNQTIIRNFKVALRSAGFARPRVRIDGDGTIRINEES